MSAPILKAKSFILRFYIVDQHSVKSGALTLCVLFLSFIGKWAISRIKETADWYFINTLFNLMSGLN